MTDEQVRRTLMLEVHRCIENAAEEAVAKLGRSRSRPASASEEMDAEALLAYPPTKPLTDDEDCALRTMSFSAIESSALKKLIADGCASAFFDFFNLLDGTMDPEISPPRETWLGGWLVAPKDDRDWEMLHDSFYAMYATYLDSAQVRGSS